MKKSALFVMMVPLNLRGSTAYLRVPGSRHSMSFPEPARTEQSRCDGQPIPRLKALPSVTFKRPIKSNSTLLKERSGAHAGLDASDCSGNQSHQWQASHRINTSHAPLYPPVNKT